MPSTADLRYAFNRGEIGKLSLGRVDRDAQRLAASTCLNWMPLAQGPMMLRPGTKYITSTLNDGVAKLIRFVFSHDDKALLELTDQNMRVLIDDTVVTRPSVTTAITSGTFLSSSGWVLTATSGATATITAGQLKLTADYRGSTTSARQTVTVPVGSQNVEHALRIEVVTGPLYFKVGTEIGDDDLVKRTKLGTGYHSLAFTPSTKFTVEFENKDRPVRIVESCTVESAGALTLPTPWTESSFPSLQYVQSGDIIYLASDVRPMKIERRSARSWSVVDYEAQLGPLRALKPREEDIGLTCDVYEGNGQLTADSPLFTSDHVGTIIRMFPTGQTKEALLAGEGVWSEPIRVAGVDQERWFNIEIGGTWSGTLTLQHSLDGPEDGFLDVAADFAGTPGTYTSNSVYAVHDHERYNNVVVWYRIGFKDGDYGGGAAGTIFTGTGASGGGAAERGSTAAYVKILSIQDSTHATIEVQRPLGSLEKTKDWLISDWGNEDGYPTSVTLFDGRLWWGGRDRLWGSVSDDYENFDHDFEGDAGPISRSLGTGPVDNIVWLLALARLMAGRSAAISSVRSSNFDEPLTPTNFTIKDASTRGAAPRAAGQVDSRGVYIHANGSQLFELVYRVESQDYTAVDLTQFNLDIGRAGFSSLAVAHAPDTRIFVVREDGQMAVVLREQDGDSHLASWWRISTTGEFEDVAVLPDDLEDSVYFVVNRTIGGATKRYIEILARRDECVGDPETKCLDSHVVYSGAATKVLHDLSHLEGQTVSVWGAEAGDTVGRDLGTYVVGSSSVGLLPVEVVTAVVGLPYTATFESAKLAYGAGLSIGAIKRIDQISLVLFDTHARGVTFGPDLDTLEPLPLVEDGEDVDEDYVWSHYDKKVTSFPGRWDGDTRLCLQAASPRPATVGAILISVDASGRVN